MSHAAPGFCADEWKETGRKAFTCKKEDLSCDSKDCLSPIGAPISIVCRQRSGRCVPGSRNAQQSVLESPKTYTTRCCKAFSAQLCSYMSQWTSYPRIRRRNCG